MSSPPEFRLLESRSTLRDRSRVSNSKSSGFMLDDTRTKSRVLLLNRKSCYAIFSFVWREFDSSLAAIKKNKINNLQRCRFGFKALLIDRFHRAKFNISDLILYKVNPFKIHWIIRIMTRICFLNINLHPINIHYSFQAFHIIYFGL